MSQITSLEIPEVNSVAGNIDAATARFSTAVAKMQRIAESLNGCWGDDEFGENFAETYLQHAEDTLAGGHLAVEGIGELAANLRKIAEMFATVDAENGGVLTLTEN